MNNNSQYVKYIKIIHNMWNISMSLVKGEIFHIRNDKVSYCSKELDVEEKTWNSINVLYKIFAND